jgi:hypothetical protein
VGTAVVHDSIAAHTRFFHKYLSCFTGNKNLISWKTYGEINAFRVFLVSTIKEIHGIRAVL